MNTLKKNKKKIKKIPGCLTDFQNLWDEKPFFFFFGLNSTDAKTPKIELELIMSDVAIRYLGALIFLVNLKYFMVTICRTGTFQLSTNL